MHVAHRCNDGYHIHCLTPPLPYIPPGEWFCTGCIQAMRDVERKGAATAAIWGGGVDERGRTGSYARQGSQGHGHLSGPGGGSHGRGANRPSPVLTRQDFENFFGPRFKEAVRMTPLGAGGAVRTQSATGSPGINAGVPRAAPQDASYPRAEAARNSSAAVAAEVHRQVPQGLLNEWAAGSALERVAVARGAEGNGAGGAQVPREPAESVEGGRDRRETTVAVRHVMCPRCGQLVDSRSVDMLWAGYERADTHSLSHSPALPLMRPLSHTRMQIRRQPHQRVRPARRLRAAVWTVTGTARDATCLARPPALPWTRACPRRWSRVCQREGGGLSGRVVAECIRARGSVCAGVAGGSALGSAGRCDGESPRRHGQFWDAAWRRSAWLSISSQVRQMARDVRCRQVG